MNAYELAKEIYPDVSKPIDVEYLKNACNMLRQQANRIKELETKYKQEFDYVEYLLKERKK